MATQSWEDIVSEKHLQDASKIPPAWRLPQNLIEFAQTPNANVMDIPSRSGILSASQLQITELYDATDLLSKIEHRELSAYEVTEAFCKRAAIAQQVVYFPDLNKNYLLVLTSESRRPIVLPRSSSRKLWNVPRSWMKYCPRRESELDRCMVCLLASR